MPEYVVLFHTFPGDSSRDDHDEFEHFDLMLQNASVLATWRINQWPPGKNVSRTDRSMPGQLDDGTGVCLATRLPDHRLHYLKYEGPVSGNRGEVRRVDAGQFQVLDRNDDLWHLKMEGESFQGLIRLAKLPGHSTLTESSVERVEHASPKTDSQSCWSLSVEIRY